MKFNLKQAAREARAARKRVGKQYRAVRAIYLEGALEVTIRSGSHEVKLTAPLHELNQFLGDVSEELRRKYLALEREEEECLFSYAEGKEQDQKMLEKGRALNAAERRNRAR